MNEIKNYIFKNYGYRLTDDEMKKVVYWYSLEGKNILDEEEFQSALIGFLFVTFPRKKIVLMEDDSSNISYLLALLKKETEK